jgi:hypothetical protein
MLESLVRRSHAAFQVQSGLGHVSLKSCTQLAQGMSSLEARRYGPVNYGAIIAGA